ncbi:hypothetical protein VTN77DRAFT_5097 [Rasamsonia byssochlamydoides]|uniref:uncharacterized protein n=1 Tax=Rasamsonia byssochlamydoides TaxID=89139 RepID=UPI003743F22A
MEDHSVTVKVVTWFLLVVSGCAVATRIAIKRSTLKKNDLDDGFAVGALLCSVVAGIGVSVAAENGLGQSTTTAADTQQIILMEKTIYVAEIFHILAICLAKLSLITLLIGTLSVVPSYQRMALGYAAFIVAWMLSSIFPVIFQCRQSRVWDIVAGTCHDMTAFWWSFGGISILTELILVTLPALMLYRIQMPMKKKVIVMSCFATRFFEIAATALQMSYTRAFNPSGPRPHLSLSLILWPWFMCAQVWQTVTLISACLPYLRPFLEALPSGMLQSEEIRRRGLNCEDIPQGFVVHRWFAAGSKPSTLRDLEGSQSGSSMQGGSPVSNVTTVSDESGVVGATTIPPGQIDTCMDPMAITVYRTVDVERGWQN